MKVRSHRAGKLLKGLWLALVLAFLYIPIIVMIALSFNASVSRAAWTGFTLDWYVKLFKSKQIMAALDLGCHPAKALYKVIIPEIMPGIVTGALLAFTMSLDDFVISYFTSNTDQNLAMIVYSAARRGVEPTMYALSTLMFVAIMALLLLVNRRSGLENI